MNYEDIMRIARSQEIRNLGMTLFDNGHYADALSNFEESLTLNPHDIKARQYHGMCKCLLAVQNPEDIQDAILDFKIVLYLHEFSSQQALELVSGQKL